MKPRQPGPDEPIGFRNFPDQRNRHCPGIEWAGLMIDVPVMRRLYRMYTPTVNFDADLVACAAKLKNDDAGAVFYLETIWQALMQNYAIRDAWKVDRRLRALERRSWVFWRIVRGYSLPRLWVALMIGYVLLLGSDRLRRILFDIAERSGPMTIALVALLGFALGLGMIDVQRRVGRAWDRVVLRSLALFGYGLFYAGAAGWLHWMGWLGSARPDWRYAALLAACALLLGHLVQLFWSDSSVSDPL